MTKGSNRRLEGFNSKTILERDHWICYYCGELAETADHVHPKFRGGQDIQTNLVACCRRCNNKKGSKPLIDWLAYLLLTDMKFRSQVLTPIADKYLPKGLCYPNKHIVSNFLRGKPL